MNTLRFVLLMLLFPASFSPLFSQNKKLDKAFQKIDSYYTSGALPKASKAVVKLKGTITKEPDYKNYLPGLYVREARINVASGILSGLDNSVNTALSSSRDAFGDASTGYAETLSDVAGVYLLYGNYRLSREYIVKARAALKGIDQLTDAAEGKLALAEAEAMIGQGFYNDAIALLRSHETYFAAHATDKETTADGKTQRVAETDLPLRYGSYAKLLTLIADAYGKKGNLISADSAFKSSQAWIRKNERFMGEKNLYLVENYYLNAKMEVENGSIKRSDKNLKFDRILNDLRRVMKPTNALGLDLYLDFLKELLQTDHRGQYQNARKEYEKVIEKNFTKSSVARINLDAVEFDSQLNRDRTRHLESDAIAIINSQALPKNYKTTERILQFLYEVAQKEKKYQNAEQYLTQITEIKKELCGENSPQYHLARIQLASYYLDFTNKIDEASRIYETSYTQVVAPEIGAWHKDNLDILNHLALLYQYTDQYTKANTALDRALDVARSKYDDQDPEYGVELDRIAQLQINLGQYEKAEQNITRSLAILDQYRKDDLRLGDYVHAVETQAKLYGIKGMFDEAEDNLDRSDRLISKAKVVASSELSAAEELSALLIQLGRYSEAERLLARQIPDYEKLYGAGSFRLIEPLINRGRILLAKGDYTEAERVALRANQIAVKTYSENSTRTAFTQKLLSDIYYTLGDYDKAEAQINKALASQEKQFTRSHIETAKSISQLALIKFYKGDNGKTVEKLMTEARDVVASKLGKDNPQYAEILKNMAVLYISEQRYTEAFNALTVAEGIWRAKTGTKNNINAAAIYTLTGDVYYQQKNYVRSEEFYSQAKNLYEKFFSTKHPEYVKVLSKLSKVYYMQKNYKRSKQLVEESLTNYESFIKQFFPALSEREKAKYWNTIKGDFEFYNTLAFSNLEDFRDLTGKVYNYQLLTKALLLNSSIKIRERILNSTDEDLKAQYNLWIQRKEQLTLALSMSQAQLQDGGIDPTALQQEVERLEKDLSQKSELFGQSFENKRITFDDVRKSLKPNEAAVEMVRYRHFDHTFTDSVIYAALYLRNELPKPKAIILKDGQKMETRYFKYYRNCIIGKIEDNISYGIFWKPIQDEIGQSATIYLSADGIYNQINLEAIPAPDGRYVIDNSNIILVSNTKDLYLRRIKTKATNPENTASMFGNPTFYATASGSQTISPLPGTEKEINQVQFMLKEKGWATAEYIEQSASEEKIKELNSPKIFHIATHGFYRPTTPVTLEEQIESNEAVLTQNPLMRTGLLLKGAGDLMEKTEYNFNMENGILTAYEAMNLNLDKTDLVVLSACETGLGDLEAGEGVYGLQRAFLVAGAKVLIMSMFKVDDDATQQLMLKFYQKWLNTGNMRQSFVDAKKELRSDYPEPIYWGAFMMIGLD